jgi:glycosyltransferase involved in cell wall biosynthesis
VTLPITALLLTFNERENIGRTLETLRWIEQVVIVDSYSTDETVAIARVAHANVTIVQRAFDTHAAQWNFGVDQVETKWVLALDADYVVTRELAAEIRDLEVKDDAVGYSARFHYCIYGTRLRGSLYPARTVLFRKNSGRYVDDGHTQVWRPNGLILPLNGYIDHDDRKPIARWINSQVKYSRLEARHLLATTPETLTLQDRLRLRIYFAAAVTVLYLIFRRGLILDGWRGWFYIAQRAIAELLLSISLLSEKHSLEPRPTDNRASNNKLLR